MSKLRALKSRPRHAEQGIEDDAKTPMGIVLTGGIFIGLLLSAGFWVFWHPIPTNNPSWVILCVAIAAGMLVYNGRERFYLAELEDPVLFTSNRRCQQILVTILFLGVFCGAMSWISGVGVMSQIFGFNSVMFLSASLIFYAHIDVQSPATF